jgi:GNAT superfamily N-acetyltransferase
VNNTREQHLIGLDYVESVTALAQRGRSTHPTKGLYEAADFQWWWRSQRPTDELGQLFWFDDEGRPEAAVIMTEWPDRIALDPIFMPDATPDQIAHVIERGLAHANQAGYNAVDLEVDQADQVLQDVLADHGFTTDKEAWLPEGIVESWLRADDRPEISPLHDGYRSNSRADTMGRAHHGIGRAGSEVEERLLQTSLYRSDLDLHIDDNNGEHAAHGLFWYDPETATGMVESMRTENDHQRRGLARHILTTGLDLLADAGAERIKIVFEPDNAGASGLYLDVGFEPVKKTAVFAGLTGASHS